MDELAKCKTSCDSAFKGNLNIDEMKIFSKRILFFIQKCFNHLTENSIEQQHRLAVNSNKDNDSSLHRLQLEWLEI